MVIEQLYRYVPSDYSLYLVLQQFFFVPKMCISFSFIKASISPFPEELLLAVLSSSTCFSEPIPSSVLSLYIVSLWTFPQIIKYPFEYFCFTYFNPSRINEDHICLFSCFIFNLAKRQMYYRCYTSIYWMSWVWINEW